MYIHNISTDSDGLTFCITIYSFLCRVSFGTTKYCTSFLRGTSCTKPVSSELYLNTVHGILKILSIVFAYGSTSSGIGLLVGISLVSDRFLGRQQF